MWKPRRAPVPVSTFAVRRYKTPLCLEVNAGPKAQLRHEVEVEVTAPGVYTAVGHVLYTESAFPRPSDQKALCRAAGLGGEWEALV